MATFDLRKELMEINDKLANLNAMVNEDNAENLAINYQVLNLSLKNLVETVKRAYPQFASELIEENRDMIKLLSKGISAHCSLDTIEKSNVSKLPSKDEPLEM